MSALFGSERHRRRGAIAARLLRAAPDAAAALAWDALDRGPAWLSAPDAELALHQRRIGAVLHVAAIRLWIDRRKVAAARAAVGEAFLRELLADSPAADVACHTTMAEHRGGDVAEWLRQAGAAVQGAAICDSPLAYAAQIALCGGADGALQVSPEAARGLIERARCIGATLATPAPEPAP